MRIIKQTYQKGFTIVELLIVIVVIGILASLVLNSFSGLQTEARNASRVVEFNAWKKGFETYKAMYGSYPNVADGGYCLGTGFPNAKCRDYASEWAVYAEADSTVLMNELSKVTKVQDVEHVPVNGTVGPYVEYTADEIYLMMVAKGDSGDCPASTEYTWDDGAGLLLCRAVLVRY
jgi:prepilin-type N-terminal cleavage/methylation domain-containing protein